MPLDQDSQDAFIFDEDELELAPLSPTLEAEIEGPEHPTRRFETVDTDRFRSAVGIPTQNRIAAQTPITADTLRRIFEPHVLDQIRNAVRQIETESEAIPEPDLVWITLDGAIPTNEVELEEGVAELVRMGQPEAVQLRYRTLVRAIIVLNLRQGNASQQPVRQARRNLESFRDNLLFGTTEADLLNVSRESEAQQRFVREALGIDGTVPTAVVYDSNGRYEPPPSMWHHVRSWFASIESPIPSSTAELAGAMLELNWLRHTRHQANRYNLYARSLQRLGVDTRSDLYRTFREVLQQIVEANQTPPTPWSDAGDRFQELRHEVQNHAPIRPTMQSVEIDATVLDLILEDDDQ